MTTTKTEDARGASRLHAELGAETIRDFRKNGWVFRYEPETRFIGAYHPHGGKQTVCELIAGDPIGFALAAYLNGEAPNGPVKGRD